MQKQIRGLESDLINGTCVFPQLHLGPTFSLLPVTKRWRPKGMPKGVNALCFFYMQMVNPNSAFLFAETYYLVYCIYSEDVLLISRPYSPMYVSIARLPWCVWISSIYIRSIRRILIGSGPLFSNIHTLIATRCSQNAAQARTTGSLSIIWYHHLALWGVLFLHMKAPLLNVTAKTP